MPQLSILVIDDDKEIREFLKDFLEGEGHAVKLIGTPKITLQVLKKDQFHLIILDLMMPNLSGLELLPLIRNIDNDVAIIIITGHPSLASATASIKEDVSDYLSKPFLPQDLRNAIARIAKKKGLYPRREEELYATIGSCIRTIRTKRGLTLNQLARRTNLSVSLLSQIERAESSASISSLFKVSTALDIPISELFGKF